MEGVVGAAKKTLSRPLAPCDPVSRSVARQPGAEARVCPRVIEHQLIIRVPKNKATVSRRSDSAKGVRRGAREACEACDRTGDPFPRHLSKLWPLRVFFAWDGDLMHISVVLLQGSGAAVMGPGDAW